MNKEIQSISSNLRNTLEGDPWFGRPVYSILHEIDPALAYQKPNEQAHALTDLLYHMINWAAFTLSRIEKDRETGTGVFEKNDWREIDPAVHNWEKGLAEFIYLHNQILHKLSEKNDDFLNEKVDNRKYDFRFLLNGLIQHNIYHLGQIAYIKKMLE